MDKSYIKSEERATKIGLWVLFFNVLMIFIWLVYESYETSIANPTIGGNHHLILLVYP